MADAERETPARALDGIRVVAFEASVAAPHCSRMLADMGAEVIKVEKPGDGDVIRHWDSAVRGLASGFVWLNWNKRSFAIDVKHPAGREAVRRLADRADVFLENFAPGVAERLGLGADELRGRNPRLVYCSMSGYGKNGPYRDVKAYDLLIQGESGIIATTGYPDQPARVGVAIADLTSSMYGALAITMALFQRERTGRGQVIDLSMLEAMVSWLGYFPHHYWHRGEEPERTGMRHPYVTPYGPYLASDEVYVSVAVASANDWEKFCREVIRRPELIRDARFETVEARRANRAMLEKLIEEIFREHPHQECDRSAQAQRAAARPGEGSRRSPGASANQGARIYPRGRFAGWSGAGDRQPAQALRQPAALRSRPGAGRGHGSDSWRARLQPARDYRAQGAKSHLARRR